jgi:molybdate-binding protein
MDCPVCHTEYVTRSGGENLTAIACRSCQRLSLWWVGLLAVAGLPKHCSTLADSVRHTAVVRAKTAGTRVAVALSRKSVS